MQRIVSVSLTHGAPIVLYTAAASDSAPAEGLRFYKLMHDKQDTPNIRCPNLSAHYARILMYQSVGPLDVASEPMWGRQTLSESQIMSVGLRVCTIHIYTSEHIIIIMARVLQYCDIRKTRYKILVSLFKCKNMLDLRDVLNNSLTCTLGARPLHLQ